VKSHLGWECLFCLDGLIKPLKMDKEFKADDIKTLSTGEAIRRRPRLYFDNCFREKTLDALPFEVLCHAFDEYLDGVCKSIEISVTHHSFTVQYDAGISLERKHYDDLSKAEAIMTEIYTCRNGKKHLSVGEEFCHLGLATINFAAEQCELTTVCNGKMGHFIFEKGVTLSREINIAETPTEFTKIIMKPDQSLFENLPFTLEGINEKARQIISRMPGLNIIIRNNIQSE
jgi:DNA gyrase/topoisomerase IV subunit B